MHDGSGRIAVQRLTKRFGSVLAVSDLSFTVEPGTITGFLGPNGSGKTTTLRALLGLVRPTSGAATVNGAPYHALGNPARVVGAVLEAQGFHPARRARAHLRVYAAAVGVPDTRVDDLLTLVGLSGAGDRKAGGYSLGMRQRLALATALLGDPQVLVLDEPANGLDPEGIAWLRGLLRNFAATGRTVLVSSHLLAEVGQTVDHAVIVSQGRCVFQGPLEALQRSQRGRVLVACADPAALAAALHERGLVELESTPDGRLAVGGADPRVIGEAALAAGVAVYGMVEERGDLEQVFFQLTSGQLAGTAPPPYRGPR